MSFDLTASLATLEAFASSAQDGEHAVKGNRKRKKEVREKEKHFLLYFPKDMVSLQRLHSRLY